MTSRYIAARSTADSGLEALTMPVKCRTDPGHLMAWPMNNMSASIGRNSPPAQAPTAEANSIKAVESSGNTCGRMKFIRNTAFIQAGESLGNRSKPNGEEYWVIKGLPN